MSNFEIEQSMAMNFEEIKKTLKYQTKLLEGIAIKFDEILKKQNKLDFKKQLDVIQKMMPDNQIDLTKIFETISNTNKTS